MIINRNREKLLNAIIYFCENTSSCYATKLFKLLYFLDFEHYKQTGRSVTGLDYFALPKGPVPQELREEIIEEPQADFAQKVAIEEVTLKGNRKKYTLTPKVVFDASCFSKRELKLLKELVYTYDMALSEDMVEATHIPTLPWHQVFNVEGRKWAKIPYEYALDEEKKELIQPLATESREMFRNYQ